MTDQGLVFNIYKQLIPFNIKKKPQNKPIKKQTEGLNKYFSKEEIQTANRHMKGCSILLIIREMQIKTTIKHHLTYVRIAVIKKNT